nr:hypothetical protein [Tanacetum cinerariifolium]
MDTTIDQQVAMDEALVHHARRLRIGRRNFRLLSDIKSKESTLQLLYDVMHLTPFFKAFLVTTDVLEICMQEFWATATVHHHSIRFKMDNKKHIVNSESFREMLHICPRLPYQPFIEPPFEEEILAFLRFLGHSGAIRRLTNVEHKDTKKSNEMYYPRFTKVIIHHFMSKDPSILRRNKVNWHYVRDDHMFTIIKLVSRHQNTQQFGALLPIELTNEDIRNSKAYKEYYAVATGATPPKPKPSKQAAKASKAKSLSALSEVAMTEAQQLKLATKRSLQQTHISQASSFGVDEGTSSIPGVPDVPTDESEEKISWNSTDEEGNDDEGNDGGDDGEEGDDDDDDAQDDDDQEDEGNDEDNEEEGSDDGQASNEEEFIHPSLSTHAEEETSDEESFDPIPKTPKNIDDEGNGEENFGTNVGREEGHDEKEEEDELYRDVNINLGRGMESIFETTSQMDVQTPTSVAPLPMSAQTLTPSTIATITKTLQAPTPSITALIKVVVQIQSDRLRDEAQAENDEFLKTIDENMQKIIKEHVKEQVKVQVSKILPKIKQTVNEQLEVEILTLSSNSSKTSYDVAADLSEMELKKILVEKIKGNKSIHRSNEQRNLYKAFVEAYESDKIILDTYGDTITLKRCRDDDADKDEEPSAGSDRGSKRRREGKEPESASAPQEKATRKEPIQTTFEMEEPSHPEFEIGADDQPIVEPSQYPEWFSQQKKPPTPDRDWNKTSELAKLSDSRSSFNELMDTPVDFSNFLMNRLKVYTLTLELLAGPTYELTKGSCKSLVELEFFLEEVYKATTDHLDWFNPEGQQYLHNLLKPLPLIPSNRGHRVIPFDHFINNDLKYLCGGASSRKYTTYVTKTKAADYGHIKWIEDLFYSFAVNRESARDVYSKRRIVTVTELKIVEWPSYKQLDWITCSDLKRKEAYIAYLNPRGFIYQNKDKQNRLRRIDELHKFSDGTLIDVRTALDDRLKRIQMKYLPQSIWRKSEKDRAAAIIQAIDKRLKTRRIMRSLERFVGGRLYEGDFRMLQRTI